MNHERELAKAQDSAKLYGWPGRSQNTPNSKTGTFTGYWRSGLICWKGAFENGDQVGLWEYHLSDTKQPIRHEFYCNL
jgi:hypothetical protein